MIRFLMVLALSCLGMSPLNAAPVVGKAAPKFSLMGSDGKTHDLKSYEGKFVVLEWWNKDCPFVKKHYDSGNMQALQKAYGDKGVVWLSVLSSAPKKQGYLKKEEITKVMTEQKAHPKTVLMDTEGKVGKMYDAKTTPHMYVINPQGILIYKGAIDDKPTADLDDVKTASNYVTQALDQAMAGKPIKVATTNPYGCAVKY